MHDADDVRDDALETLAECMPGLRGPTREPRARVTLVDVETDAVVIKVASPPAYPPTLYRITVSVETLDAAPCEFEVVPARMFPPPEPAELCEEDSVPGARFCREHVGAAA